MTGIDRLIPLQDMVMTLHKSDRTRRLAPVFLMALLLGCVFVSHRARAQSDNDPRTIEIEAQSGLTYSPVRFRVDPGQKIRLILKNTDRLLHNMLITKPGKRLDVVNSAMDLGASGKEKNYVPDSKNVLWNIRILGQGEQGELQFEAPETEDVYPYVCTLPGHGFTMYGAMYVQEDDNLPPVAQDPHLPDQSAGDSATNLLEPLPDRARVYREFLPAASPAAIAVALPTGGSDQAFSYCFDAARCRIRYAWVGGFIDVPYRRGDKAEIKGNLFYRNTAGFPIRFGRRDNKPEHRKFLGYGLERGLPTFRYRVDGHRVKQTVKHRPDGPGIIQKFEISDVDEPVVYVPDAGDSAMVNASNGNWQTDMLKLSPDQAKNFSITIIPTRKNASLPGNKDDK